MKTSQVLMLFAICSRFAFVDFGTVEESQRALKELNGIDCKGSKIIVDIIKSADVIERSKTNLDSQRKPPSESITSMYLHSLIAIEISASYLKLLMVQT